MNEKEDGYQDSLPARPHESDLFVNEIYGPTFQGEGLSIGRPCWFVRLAGCNLKCGFCDSAYTWDWGRFDKMIEVHRMPAVNVIGKIIVKKPSRVVVTGGEPLLQQRNLSKVVSHWMSKGIFVEIETAGTIAPTFNLADQYNVSPKLAHAGNAYNDAINKPALRALMDTGKANFKFVVTSVDDMKEVDDLVLDLNLRPVLIMPEGVTREAIIATTERIASAVVARGYILTTRLHTLAFGTRRKV